MAQSLPTLVEDPNDPGTFLIQDMAIVGASAGSGLPSVGSLPPQDTQLIWGSYGDNVFETGVDRGVLYLEGKGIPWIGLRSLSESSSGGEAQSYYLDGLKYANQVGSEEFSAKLDAYTYPDEFELCDGMRELDYGVAASQQVRKPFNLSYRTLIGNDVNGMEHGYKLHIVYNAKASPTERTYDSLSEEIDPMVFSWNLSTTPIHLAGYKPIAHLIIDSRKIHPYSLRAIEEILYGVGSRLARLPELEEMLEIIGNTIPVRIVQDYSTGLSPLIKSGAPDLYNGVRLGLFRAMPNTRLVETTTPGLYTLE